MEATEAEWRGLRRDEGRRERERDEDVGELTPQLICDSPSEHVSSPSSRRVCSGAPCAGSRAHLSCPICWILLPEHRSLPKIFQVIVLRQWHLGLVSISISGS